jgi:hypothetical protein
MPSNKAMIPDIRFVEDTDVDAVGAISPRVKFRRD